LLSGLTDSKNFAADLGTDDSSVVGSGIEVEDKLVVELLGDIGGD
jgi:hypothetical protein